MAEEHMSWVANGLRPKPATASIFQELRMTSTFFNLKKIKEEYFVIHENCMKFKLSVSINRVFWECSHMHSFKHFLWVLSHCNKV